jgi:hypothetical protein
MSFNTLIEKIPFVNPIDNALVCEADFIGLHGVVMQKKSEMLTVTVEVHAEAEEMQKAVEEVASQARKQGWTGKRVILLTPAVVMAPLELVVPHKNKLPPKQMAETVSWELEPLMSQHRAILSIGQLLLANGFITPEQVEEVLHAQMALNNGKQNDQQFGTLAVELGFVKTAQLNQCLARQAWFVHADEDLQCAWQPLKATIKREIATYRWLVAGMKKLLLRQWQAAFAQHGMVLEQCYPLAGSAMLNPNKADSSKKQQKSFSTALVIDLYEGIATATCLYGGEIAHSHTLSCDHSNVLTQVSDLYHRLQDAMQADLQGSTAPLFDAISLVDQLSKSELEAKQLSVDIEQVLSKKVQMYTRPASHVSLGMRSAAKHFMRFKQSGHLIGVSVYDPMPPAMQRFEVKILLTAGAALLLVLGAEASLLARKALIDYQNEQIAEDLNKVNAAISRIEENINHVKKLKESIKTKKAEVAALDAAVTLIELDLPKRNQTIVKLLQALEQAVTEEIVIDRVSEDTIAGFSLTAWALNEQAAQAFIKYYQIAIHPLDYRLKDITVTEQTGRLGLLGYAVNFNATALSDQDWAAYKLAPNLPLIQTSKPK